MSRPIRPFQPEVEFSIIISCYFEEPSIDEFYTRLSSTMQKMGRSYEIIFINDGSTDATFEKLEALFHADPNVTAVIDLHKNAGQANAKTPGIMIARGKAFVLIDSDLQLDPEELPKLVEAYDRGVDIVSGYRRERRDSLARSLPSILANTIMRKASQSKLRDFGCTFKIYDGALVRSFEFGPFKPWRSVPVIAAAGRLAEVEVTHRARKYGKSGWTFKKLFAYNMENLVLMSDRPFQLLGVLCTVLAGLFIVRIGLAWTISISIIPTITNGLLLNMVLLDLLVTLAVLCVIGEFTIRVFAKSQKSPVFTIRRILQNA